MSYGVGGGGSGIQRSLTTVVRFSLLVTGLGNEGGDKRTDVRGAWSRDAFIFVGVAGWEVRRWCKWCCVVFVGMKGR